MKEEVCAWVCEGGGGGAGGQMKKLRSGLMLSGCLDGADTTFRQSSTRITGNRREENSVKKPRPVPRSSRANIPRRPCNLTAKHGRELSRRKISQVSQLPVKTPRRVDTDSKEAARRAAEVTNARANRAISTSCLENALCEKYEVEVTCWQVVFVYTT